MSTTIPVQIRIDKTTREQANELFKELGTDMSGAVNMFLKQCVLTDGIPFEVRRPYCDRRQREVIGDMGDLDG